MIAVIKIGGELLQDDRAQLSANLQTMRDSGWQLVLVHGGGPQVSLLQRRLGLKVKQVGGRRVTGPEDLLAVQQALVGEVNSNLVAELLRQGLPAFGCHGASAALLEARRRPPTPIAGQSAPVDLGAVGDVTKVNSALLRSLLDLELMPVIATLGVDSNSGTLYNINADTSAVAIAQALDAEWLMLVGTSGGVRRDIDDPHSRISALGRREALQLIASGVINAGMQAKVEEALGLVEQSGIQVASLSVDDPDALLNTTCGRDFSGTLFIAD